MITQCNAQFSQSTREDLSVCVLRFYDPVNPMGSCRERSVYLTTLLLGRFILYCPFDITRKDVFFFFFFSCLAFDFKWKYFVLTDHILSKTICLFCFCVFFSNSYPKIKFTAKNWSDLCNFYSKVIFWIFCLWRYFHFSLLDLNYWCFTTKMWKFQNPPPPPPPQKKKKQKKKKKKTNEQNLLKIFLQDTNYRLLNNLHSFFIMGKSENIRVFENQWLEFFFLFFIYLFIFFFLYISSYDKWFCIKSWQKFANLLLGKAPSAKRLSEKMSKA